MRLAKCSGFAEQISLLLGKKCFTCEWGTWQGMETSMLSMSLGGHASGFMAVTQWRV